MHEAYFWSSNLIARDREIIYLDTHAKLAAKIGLRNESEIIEQEISDLKAEKELKMNCMNGVCKKTLKNKNYAQLHT